MIIRLAFIVYFYVALGGLLWLGVEVTYASLHDGAEDVAPQQHLTLYDLPSEIIERVCHELSNEDWMNFRLSHSRASHILSFRYSRVSLGGMTQVLLKYDHGHIAHFLREHALRVEDVRHLINIAGSSYVMLEESQKLFAHQNAARINRDFYIDVALIGATVSCIALAQMRPFLWDLRPALVATTALSLFMIRRIFDVFSVEDLPGFGLMSSLQRYRLYWRLHQMDNLLIEIQQELLRAGEVATEQ